MGPNGTVTSNYLWVTGVVTATNVTTLLGPAYSSMFIGFTMQDSASAFSGIAVVFQLPFAGLNISAFNAPSSAGGVFMPSLYANVSVGGWLSTMNADTMFFGSVNFMRLEAVSAAPFAAASVSTAAFSRATPFTAASQRWRNMLVSLQNATVTAYNSTSGQVTLDDGSGALLLDALTFDGAAAGNAALICGIGVGTTFTSLAGLVRVRARVRVRRVGARALGSAGMMLTRGARGGSPLGRRGAGARPQPHHRLAAAAPVQLLCRPHAKLQLVFRLLLCPR